MTSLVVLPVLVPLATAVACLALRAWRRPLRVVSAAGAVVHLIVAALLLARVDGSGIEVMHLSAWPAPFGISLVADRLAAVLALLTGITGLAIVIHSLISIDRDREHHGYHPLLHTLLAGVSMAFLTGDLFNLYVAFEVTLMASFVLLALGGERAQLEGAVKYVTLNLLSSAVLLAAVGVIYGVVGTLNMADLAVAVARGAAPGLVTTLACLLLVAFGIKAAVFPLFFWLPASYHTPPVAVSALFAGLLTKVGVYSLLRVFTLIFTGDIAFTHSLILIVASLTMVTGVLGAVAQYDVRRLLAFHSISQVGYMLIGLGLLSPLGLAGSVFFLVHHGLVKSSLFLIAGAARQIGGSDDVRRLGGLWRTHPGLSLTFAVQAASLAGIPPLSGFWAKLLLVKAALDAHEWVVAGVALAVGLLTLFSMVKIWSETYWKDAPADAVAGPARLAALVQVSIAVLVVLSVSLGLGAGPAVDFSNRAAAQLADPSEYIRAVLGGEAGR